MAPLLAKAQQLRLRLLLDDAMIDPIDARIDLAIRVGRLADSSWVARRLRDFEIILCASPDYLARHGTPASPQQLPAHQWLALAGETTREKSQSQTTLLDMYSSNGERHSVRIEARIESNNQVSVQQMCEHGLGVARLVHADVLAALERGALVRVLHEYRLRCFRSGPSPRGSRQSEAAKVRAAADYLKRYFAKLPVPALVRSRRSTLTDRHAPRPAR